jgi:hypothetical protein
MFPVFDLPQGPPAPEWWLADANGQPIGPMSTDLLSEWVRAGLVASGAFVCRIGCVDWQPISDIEPFAVVASARRFDPAKELCLIDIESLPPAPAETEPPDPSSEVTVVAVPRPSRPPGAAPRNQAAIEDVGVEADAV